MSTTQQVQNDYYCYVYAYLVSKGVETNTNYYPGSSQIFQVTSDGKATTFSKWNNNVTPPSINDLMQITPSTIASLKQYADVNLTFDKNPKLLAIFRDLYNRITLLQLPANNYANDQSMKNYFKNLM